MACTTVTFSELEPYFNTIRPSCDVLSKTIDGKKPKIIFFKRKNSPRTNHKNKKNFLFLGLLSTSRVSFDGEDKEKNRQK